VACLNPQKHGFLSSENHISDKMSEKISPHCNDKL